MRIGSPTPTASLRLFMLTLVLAGAMAGTPATASTAAPMSTTGTVSLSAIGVSGPVAAGTNLVLRASVADVPDARRARFYDGNSLIGVDRNPPWEMVVRKISPGTHDFRVELITTGSSPLVSPLLTITSVVVPVNEPPTISILTPARKTTVKSGTPITLTANATDPDGRIDRVEYWNGAVLIDSSTTPPYQIAYVPTTTGKFTIVAKAFDDGGASTTSSPITLLVMNVRPTVSLLSPANNTTVPPGTSIDLTADARDPDGTIDRVEYWTGKTLVGSATAAPFTVSFVPAVSGKISLVARAFDNNGASTTSAPVSISIVNKPPIVSILTPAANASIVQGTPVDLTASATDSDGNIARVEYWAGQTLLGSATTPPYKLAYTPTALGNVTVVAKAFDNNGASATSPPVSLTVVIPPPVAAVADDQVRLLLQATFGPTAADIAHIRQVGINGWLDEQFALPLTYSHLTYLQEVKTLTGKDAGEEHAYEAIWQNFLFGADQLRARVAFALSEIIVISNIAPDQNTWALGSWMDMLYRNAFGNFRTLMEDATLHPAMGYYLNMLGNDKENPAKGFRPNENYARELMQLFTIGLVKLNPDGTPIRDALGNTQPTYNQAVVEGYAQVFTGWNFAGNNTDSNSDFYWPPVEDWINPMVPWPKRHSPGTKLLLDGRTLAAGQTPQQDLKDALDSIFNHPNVGPFISRRLIQFLVTSNPSPGYVSRVGTIFNNNGSGIRGDLKAVVRAILLDAEARSVTLAASPTFGKLREPVVRFTHLMRATSATAANGRNSVWWLDNPEYGLGQSPLLAPSVFNFFSPFFTRPGPIARAGLVAPEFQIHTETQVVGNANFFGMVVGSRGFGFTSTGKLLMDLAPWTALAANPTSLVDQINLVFAANALSVATRASMTKAVAAVPASKTTERVRVALTLLMVAPDFVVQH